MSPGFDLSAYEPVEERIARFYDKHSKGRIITDCIERTEKSVVFMATVYRDDENPKPAATGWAQETVGSSPVNRTSAVENCETSACGRALANLGFSPKGKRPSREEMSKSQRVESAKAEPSAASDTSRSNLPAAAPPADSSPTELMDTRSVVLWDRIENALLAGVMTRNRLIARANKFAHQHNAIPESGLNYDRIKALPLGVLEDLATDLGVNQSIFGGSKEPVS